jgi:hypothetical protein
VVHSSIDGRIQSGMPSWSLSNASIEAPLRSENGTWVMAATLRPTRDADPGQFEIVGQWSAGRCRSGAAARDDPTSHRGGNQALFFRTFVNTERTGSGRSGVFAGRSP